MKQVVLFTILALLILAAGAGAQVPAKPVDLYVGGGVTVPTGSFGDVQKLGFNGYGRANFNLRNVVNLVAGVDFHQLPFDDGGAGGFDGGDARLLMITGGVKYPITLPASPIKPSMMFETGLALYSVSDLTQPTEEIQEFENQEKIFISFGVGVDISRFFAVVRYIDVFTDGDDATMLPLTVGVKF